MSSFITIAGLIILITCLCKKIFALAIVGAIIFSIGWVSLVIVSGFKYLGKIIANKYKD